MLAPADPEVVRDALSREGISLVLVDNFAGPRSEALRRFRDLRDGSLESLLRLPGNVELLRVKR